MFKFFIIILLSFLATGSTSQSSIDINCADHIMYAQSFGTGTPILIINGGPGMNSNGFAALGQFNNGLYLVEIKDIGNGKSVVERIVLEQ